tara:strand:- start:1147 stop:1635 length:489 start_codon:yes stop_codon:yes gene_type:complete
MNKKGVSILLKFIIGLVIALIVIWALFTVVDKLIIFKEGKENSQEEFFLELNEKIKETGINKRAEQFFELQERFLLISFNKGDTEAEGTMIRRPLENKNLLCLCITQDKKHLFGSDCLQPGDTCIEHKKNIMNSTIPFSLFGKGTYNLNIEKTLDKINIEYE